MAGLQSRLTDWIHERFDLSGVAHFAAEKRVPDFRGSFWYYFGGVSLFLFIVQVVTGILLLMYYQPGARTAFESVHFIISRVQFGWLICVKGSIHLEGHVACDGGTRQRGRSS